MTAAALAAAVAVLAGAAWLLLGIGPDTHGADLERLEVRSSAVPGEHPAVAVVRCAAAGPLPPAEIPAGPAKPG